MKENSIIINKRYFNNIEKAVNSLNQFFSSNFQQKNLLKVDDVSDLDQGIKDVLDSIDTIDSRWITNPELVADAADKLNEEREDVRDFAMNNNDGDAESHDFIAYCDSKGDTSLLNTAREFLSFKALEQISDNMPLFEKLLNGIYSFELFTTPSKFRKEIETFTNDVPKGECSDVLGSTKYSVFDIKEYINGLFENDDIELPDDMDPAVEKERVTEMKDLPSDVKVVVNDAVTEAAEVNFFTDTKPKNIKYANGKWEVSTQFEKTVDNLISDLRKCESSDDLKSFIESNAKKYTSALNDTVAPFILVQGFIKKASVDGFAKYSDSYKSIVSKNGGAKRFENYDIFTTFKSDKEGTLKFISDFCKLKLVTDPKARIANNTLLTLFNIFDSRIYFDIMYNMIPDKEKKDKGMDEDSFVRKQRAIINNNSRNANPYQNSKTVTDDTESTTNEINEYAYNMIRSMGDMDTTDMMLCESWHDMLHDEIKTVDDGLYNAGIPISATCEYIGESFDVIDSVTTQVFVESSEEHAEVIKQTVLGGLVGGSIAITLLAVSSMLTVPVSLFHAMLLGGSLTSSYAVLYNKIAKKSRGKNIKSEIIRDTNAVIRALAKETDEIDDYIIRDLKKRARTLMETLSFAIKRKDLFKDEDREKLIDLHHAATKINTNISIDNLDKNKSVIENFFKAADAVLRIVANIKKYELQQTISSDDDIDEVDNETTETTEGESSDEASDDESDEDENDDTDDKPTQESAIQEVDDGSIPEYMKTRMKLADKDNKQRTTTVEPASVPSNDGDVPSNSIDDLSMSIDAKVNAADDNINDVIGRESKKEGSNIVYNITNNYTYSNSFNKTSNDLSQNKHVDNSVHADKATDLSNNNDLSSKDQSNNKYNSTGSSDTNDEKIVKEFSTGYSVEDVFALLSSEEPLLEASGTKPPKEDSLTKAMDRDRKKLPKQQAAKKAVDTTVGTAKAVTKPVVRTKHWLLGIVDSLVKRREDKVKAEIIESPSYRTALFKASRIAIKIGLTGVAFTINRYLGAAYLLLQASNAYDKQRLRNEVEQEFATEMRILDKKIHQAEMENTQESRQAMYKMMRLRGKMERIATKEAPRARVKHPSAVQ